MGHLRWKAATACAGWVGVRVIAGEGAEERVIHRSDDHALILVKLDRLLEGVARLPGYDLVLGVSDIREDAPNRALYVEPARGPGQVQLTKGQSA